MMLTEFKETEIVWRGNTRTNTVHLVTIGHGMTYVMVFERWGMRNAKPFFGDLERGVIRAFDEMIEVDHNSVFTRIDNEAARRIVAAWNACKGIPTAELEAMTPGALKP